VQVEKTLSAESNQILNSVDQRLPVTMTKHSKNNTASSIFSYAEYKKLDYGTKRQRLGNESMRQFDACSLCLQRAREPLSCGSGHLFCKECVYTDLCALPYLEPA
jgi:hypothetical protein